MNGQMKDGDIRLDIQNRLNITERSRCQQWLKKSETKQWRQLIRSKIFEGRRHRHLDPSRR